jgi:hypothetical protein
MNMDPRHIGDGVYVSRNADGSAEIAVNHHANKVVFLEPEVIKRLVDYFAPGDSSSKASLAASVSGMPCHFVYAEDSFFPPNVHGILRNGVTLHDHVVEKAAGGFLTREEREAIEAAKEAHGYWTTDTEQEEVLDGLLDRDSKNPPAVEEASHGLERWLGERPKSRSIVINAESRFRDVDSNDTAPLPGREEVSFVLRERLVGGQLVFFRTTVSVSEFGDGVKASDAVVQFARVSMDKFLFDKAAEKAKQKGDA